MSSSSPFPSTGLGRRAFVGSVAAAAATAGFPATAYATDTPATDTPATATDTTDIATAHTTTAAAGGVQPSTPDAATRRARDLVAQMTLDEKIALVHGDGFGLGDYAGSIPANTRLGIPALYLGDGPDGVGNGATGVTQWPCAANRAATWDPALVGEFGGAYGAEQHAKGRNIALAPTVNILRRPNWGRAFETFTEDPYLNAVLATAVVRGIQDEHVVATVKHYAANNQEIDRDTINVVVSRRALEEIYYPAFHAGIRHGGAGAVMGAYNKVNGTYSCENAPALTEVLRREWGFTGFVMSDWFATHSTVESANAGLDMEMPGGSSFGLPQYFGDALKAAVQAGTVPAARLDAMVTGIVRSLIRIGVFDHPAPDPAAVLGTDVSTPEHRALATRLSEQGSVLLKNADRTLPLDPARLRRLAVIGDCADAHPKTSGGGSASVIPSAPPISPLAGITNRVAGNQVHVTYTPGTLGTGALAPIPSSALIPASGGGAGLTGVYYPTADFTGTPLATQVDPNLDFTTTPPAVANAATWSAQWSGWLVAPADGEYRFSVSGGGTITLAVDGTTLVAFTNGYETVQDGFARLTAGRHAVKVTLVPHSAGFFGGQGLRIGWQPQQDLLIAEAVAAARAADAAVVFVNDAVSEGMDRHTLALPAGQDALIDAVAAANPRTVVVLNTSAAVLMPWLGRVAAVVEAWYAGQTAGTAIAALLFGDVNPSGKLPHTFPASDRQGPAKTPAQYPGTAGDVDYDEGVLVGYRWYDHSGEKPLFPFGHGLSYTTFAYSDLRVHRADEDPAVTVTARVRNTGRRAGAEVAQLYLSSPASAGEPPKQLKGFHKVVLQPGETATLVFPLDRAALAAWDDRAAAWRVHGGEYGVAVGGSSADLPLRSRFRL